MLGFCKLQTVTKLLFKKMKFNFKTEYKHSIKVLDHLTSRFQFEIFNLNHQLNAV